MLSIHQAARSASMEEVKKDESLPISSVPIQSLSPVGSVEKISM
jgi:hypothetical protein